jgi:hypothetical protein
VALQSKLFRGDKALEKCLVQDSAHVVPGASGPHVAKIQRALAILDGALMEAGELSAATYGPSTAAAVLQYKRARSIINRSYQQQADNIVGKMTIASLDRGLAMAERRPMTRACREPHQGGGGAGRFSSSAVVSRTTASQVTTVSQPLFPATLAVLFQLVRVRDQLGTHSFDLVAETPRRANELLMPFGLRVAPIHGFSFAVPHKVHLGEEEEFVGLRKAAENAMPGFRPALRVIVCPFRKDDTQADDLKNNAVSMSVQGFDRFIVMNSNLLRADRGTLLHEMIHCSDASLMGEIGIHDADGSGSIFSWDGQRTKLHPHHAKSLQSAFFSSRGNRP